MRGGDHVLVVMGALCGGWKPNRGGTRCGAGPEGRTDEGGTPELKRGPGCLSLRVFCSSIVQGSKSPLEQELRLRIMGHRVARCCWTDALESTNACGKPWETFGPREGGSCGVALGHQVS